MIPVFLFHVHHLGPLCACHDCLYRPSNAFLSDVSQGGKRRHLAELELSSLWLLIVTWTFRSPRKWAPDVSKWESVWTWAAPVERKERLMSFFFFSKGWPWKEVGLEWGGCSEGAEMVSLVEGLLFFPPSVPFPLFFNGLSAFVVAVLGGYWQWCSTNPLVFLFGETWLLAVELI